MSTAVVFNGTSYSIPAAGEVAWASLSNFLIAVANNTQTVGKQLANVRTATTTPASVSAATDFCVIVNLTVAGASAVTLPTGTNKQLFVVVDGKGDAATNNITVSGTAQNIRGSATYVINSNFGAAVFQFSTTEGKWIIQSEGFGLVPITKGGTGSSTAAGARTNLGLGTIATAAATDYALLAGQAGGQTLRGDTASGGNLVLNSTANATKGKLILGASSAYDEANARLGLGTTSPADILHVVKNGGFMLMDNAAASSWGLKLRAGGTDSAVFTANGASGEVRIGGVVASYFPTFYSANAEAMRIDLTGKVGIGTSSPATTLDVVGGGRFGQSSNLRLQSSVGQFERPSSAGLVSPTGSVSINAADDTGGGATVGLYYYSNVNGWSSGAEVANTASAKSDFLLMKSGGKVGIGAPTPGATLDVRATAAADIVSIVKGTTAQTGNLTEWQNVSGTVLSKIDSSGNHTLNAQTEMRFADADSSHYVGFKCPATVTVNKVWTLPSVDGSSGQVLITDGAAVLSWAAALTSTLADGRILVGNAASVATAVIPTGDVTISNTGVTAIASGVIVDADVSGSAAIAGSKLVAAASGVVGAVSAGTQTMTGVKTFETQLIGKGTATNDSAAAGYIGEVIRQTRLVASATTATSNTALNITGTALTLTAGDWDIFGTIGFNTDATTSVTSTAISISRTSATVSADSTLAVPNSNGEYKRADIRPAYVPGNNSYQVLNTPNYRVSLSADTIFYLVGLSTFTVAGLSVWGCIEARRSR